MEKTVTRRLLGLGFGLDVRAYVCICRACVCVFGVRECVYVYLVFVRLAEIL